MDVKKTRRLIVKLNARIDAKLKRMAELGRQQEKELRRLRRIVGRPGS